MRLVALHVFAHKLRFSPKVDFVDFDLINRIFGVSPCHPQARTGVVVVIHG